MIAGTGKAVTRSDRLNDASAPTPVIENFEPNFRNGSIPTSEAIAGSAVLSSF
jgi:hypothetical protein